MRVLIDIVHPADVLFFLHPLRQLQDQGHQTLIVARDKDVVIELLEAFELPYQLASRARPGVLQLAVELLVRDMSLWRLVRQFRPDVLCGFGGVSISHVGRLLGIPAISFYDTERANLQQRLTLPFITHLYVPNDYTGKVAPGRTSRFSGPKELSYFHPDNFRVDRERALVAGWDPERPNYFLRLVAWGANHDLGRGGMSSDTLTATVERLVDHGCLHISSESSLSEALQPYGYTGGVADIHHLLGCCDLYVGESATMAAEAVLLGVPAIYAVDDYRGYIDSMIAAGLVKSAEINEADAVLATVMAGLEIDLPQWRQQQQRWLVDQPNLAPLVTRAILRHGAPSETVSGS